MARTIADALNELYQNGVKGKITTWINDYKSNLITVLAPTFLKITDAANTYLTKTGKAASASYADSAGSATTATNANYATSAGTAAACTGNAATATTAQNANYANSAGSATNASKVTGGTITLTGDVTGTATFNSAGNVSIACTVDRSNIFEAVNANAAALERDCNNLITAGFWRIFPSSNAWANFPGTNQVDAKYFLVLTRKDTNTVIQMAFNYAGQAVFYRAGYQLNSDSPTWSTWQRISNLTALNLTGAITGSGTPNYNTGEMNIATSASSTLAAATAATANYSETTNNAKALSSTILARATDLNTVITPGIYSIYCSTAEGTLNAPTNLNRINVQVIQGSTTSRVQVAYKYDGSVMWIRGSENATADEAVWTAWHKVDLTAIS